MTAIQLDLIDWLGKKNDTAAPIPEPAILYRIDKSRNMARFYALSIARDLFGQWCLVRRYGRIGARRGTVKHETFPTYRAAQNALEKLRDRKFRKGYAPG